MSDWDRKRWLTKREAAEYCGRLSVRHLERHVLPYVSCVRIGARVCIDADDLDAWLAAQKVGPCTEIHEAKSGLPDSPTQSRDDRSSDQQVREIRRRRRRRLNASTSGRAGPGRRAPSAAGSSST